jgi:primosomal protein N' (replication factor Y)
MKLVQVWIEHPVRQLDQPFTYLSEEPIAPGTRVSVLFNGRRVIGFTESCQDTEWSPEEAEKNLGFRLQYIESVLDQESLITPELHDLALGMAQATLSPVISCFQAMLPGKIKPASSRKAVVMEDWVKAGSRTAADLTPRQQEALAYLQANGEIPYRELRRHFPNQARELVDKGAAEIRSREKEAGMRVSTVRTEPFALSREQAQAMQEIESTADSVYLIRGVTGSGKTEIYLQLARKVLDAGRQVLILVPEISLTPQMIERVEQRFGQDLAIYHSALNPQQKYEQYRKVKSGRAAIVVGTRSAVFLPFSDLGLIVMDEEQDASYKQENQPAYHCRDVAIERGRYHHCKVILGSATPALESYARGLKGVYHLVELNERINKSLPKVTIVPLQEAMRKGQSYILSDDLSAKMQQRLEAHRQIILLLNRRGYSSLLRCRSCHEALLCPHCDIAMSYHRDERLLKCHTCGYQMPVPAACPKCGSTAGFTSQGYGTERLEQEVQKKFPAARILRMDADTTGRKDSHERF